MQSKAITPGEYIRALPEERKQAISEIRKVILKNLPEGFSEIIAYGMIGYVVPHSLYPKGYHCDPKQPLPFLNLASQKNYMAFYHMGLYDEELLTWLKERWTSVSKKKLDMGKCCLRFKKLEDVPLVLIAELVSKMTPLQWIAHYERQIKR